jgi:hypothetical protein
MYWKVEIPIIVRNLINDLDTIPTYTDDRINQLVVVAARYVINEVNLNIAYNIDIINTTITPDPSDPDSRDIDFVGFVALKASCLLDQSTFRTRAINEGISASLGPARLSVGGNLSGFKTILEMGPCGTYEQLVMDHNIGDISTVRAVLSPFVGNNFDPRYLMRSNVRGRDFF